MQPVTKRLTEEEAKAVIDGVERKLTLQQRAQLVLDVALSQVEALGFVVTVEGGRPVARPK